VGLRTDDDLAHLIAGAFLPACGSVAADRPRFSLAVARHGEPLRLPPAVWADEWTRSARVVPAEITHPYRVFLDRQVGVAYAVDRSTGRAAVWVRRADELDLRSFITPFRLALSWLAGTFGAEVVHASAAVVDDRAIAFSGASGSGKSTLAIGLGLAGHRFVSDDCLLLHDGVAYAVFARAKVDDHSAAIVGTAARGLPLSRLPDTPRAKRFLAVDALGDAFAPQFALHAWGFPVLGLGTGHYRLAERRAFRLLAADSLREIFGGGPVNRLRLAREIRRVPGYRLLVGESMTENAEVVRAALAGGRLPAEAVR